VVTGATHAGDAVAERAQADLTTAYGVAAGQTPVTRNLTGTDLGGLTLTPGVYKFDTSAQLTGKLTLDGTSAPDAQFVFQIGSTLTTASDSLVELINASPCNVYWQIGSSATLGTRTAFQGNLLADTSITLNTGASVIGRALARTGAVTLDTNSLDGSRCGTRSTPTSPPAGTPPSDPGSTPPAPTTPPGAPSATPPAPPSDQTTPAPAVTRKGRAIMRPAPRKSCTAGFRATVRGNLIKRVVFRLDGRRIASRTRSPFRVLVRGAPGVHKVRARVTFKDATRAKTLTLRYRACAAKVLRPRRGPSQFTG
jgi:type VI secretion system secreted protein VgrG